MYKCMNDEAPNYLCDLFMLFTERLFVHERITRQVNDLYVPFAHTNYYKKSIGVYGASLWNKLPNEIKNAANIFLYKDLVELNCCMMFS